MNRKPSRSVSFEYGLLHQPLREPWESVDDQAQGGTLKAERIQEKLKAERIQQRLAMLPGWQTARDGSALRRTFELPTIRAATLLVSLVAEIGEAAGFVPVIRMHYLEVTLVIDTDRTEGLTDLDFDLAELFSLCT